LDSELPIGTTTDLLVPKEVSGFSDHLTRFGRSSRGKKEEKIAGSHPRTKTKKRSESKPRFCTAEILERELREYAKE
jgi:hypothetical protein